MKTPQPPHRPHLKPALLALAAAALAALAAWSAHGLHAGEAPAAEVPALIHEGDLLRVPEQSPLRRALVVAAVPEQQVAVPFTLPALVEADPGRLVRVAPPMAGRIVRLDKQLGDEVRVGDVLFTLDAPDFAQAGADAAKARAALAMAERTLRRQRELDQSELGAKRELEQAQNDFDQASAEAARATARLAQTGAHAGTGAGGSGSGSGGGGGIGAGGMGGTSGGLLVVRSPIAGRVVELAGAAGAYWNDASAPLMTVADLSRVFVSANAQEKDMARLYLGQRARIQLDAYPEPLTGEVRDIAAMLDADTRTVRLRMPFDNRDGRLKPGMFAEATLLARPHPGLLLPMTAVIQSGFASRAFVEVRPWQFAARELKLGAQVGEQVEVLGGLRAGERVVVKDGVLLND